MISTLKTIATLVTAVASVLIAVSELRKVLDRMHKDEQERKGRIEL